METKITLGNIENISKEELQGIMTSLDKLVALPPLVKDAKVRTISYCPPYESRSHCNKQLPASYQILYFSGKSITAENEIGFELFTEDELDKFPFACYARAFSYTYYSSSK
jgi:hypothetical protein